MKSNGNRSRVSNDREVLTPARVGSFVSVWERGRKVVVEFPHEGNKIGAHKGSSENARKAFDEMPKSVSGEDKVTLGDPEGSEGTWLLTAKMCTFWNFIWSETKNHWACDDPAFIVVCSLLLAVSTLANCAV
ncbi:hypothetical protein U1Q18_047611 [Sarracenia purpurea var. burkii]